MDGVRVCVGGGGRNVLVLDAGRKSLAFSVRIEIELFLVWVVDIGLILVWGSKLA